MNAFATLALAGFVYACIVGVTVYPFILHVVRCIQTESWFLLAFGLAAFPVGWFHGVYVMLFV